MLRFLRRLAPGEVFWCRDGLRRAVTVAGPLRLQGYASPGSSPVRTSAFVAPPVVRAFSFHALTVRPACTSSFALRPAVPPLHSPLYARLSCRHGESRR